MIVVNSSRGNRGIIITGGALNARDLAVGDNASIVNDPRQLTPLADVPSLLQRPRSSGFDTHERKRDVFISHAHEDKAAVARPLAEALLLKHVDVWIDEIEFSIGDSIRRRIDSGLAAARMGVVILSRDFISKGWTNYELDGLISRSATGEQVLLPIWHNITRQEVADFSPSLADKVARDTRTHSVEAIAEEISGVLREKNGL